MHEENSNGPHGVLHGYDILATAVLSQICHFVV